MARVLIVSETEAAARLLEMAFETHPLVEIIGHVYRVEDAVRISNTVVPDLVVIASGVVIRQDAVGLAEQVYKANGKAVVVVTAELLSEEVRKELLEVCAIPLATDILELPYALELLIPDLRPAGASIPRAPAPA